MPKIGLLTCANVTQEMGCTMSGCIQALQKHEGFFESHKGSGETQLMGVVSCAGCPTAYAPEKILNRVRGLVSFGADTIHISSCLTMICPFLNKYEKILSSSFPHVKVISGTHAGPPGAEMDQVKVMFAAMTKDLLGSQKKTLPDAMMAAMGPPATGTD